MKPLEAIGRITGVAALAFLSWVFYNAARLSYEVRVTDALVNTTGVI